MIRGQIIAGEFDKIVVRQKSKENLELGELLVTETPSGKILLQVYDLQFGSQISQQNLELISGVHLEEEDNNLELLDKNLRTYNLALLKPILATDKTGAKLCKLLPEFFSTVRKVQPDDLRFITSPKNPLMLGKLRSGSKILDVNISLDGEKVFCHHILVAATTGKGKSLDENQEVLIKQNNNFSVKPIGEIVNNSTNFKGSKVFSMNPKNYSMDLKKITNFVKHRAPKFMYKVSTESGREVMVTKDHNLYVLRDGKLQLSKTQEISNKDYLPVPIKINEEGNQRELNLFDLLKDYKTIYVVHNKELLNKLKPKDQCVTILSKHFKNPLAKYNNFVLKRNKIQIYILRKLLKSQLTYKDLKSINLTDQIHHVKLTALYPLTKEFLQLIGYYIAEGYSQNENTFRISCSDTEGRNLLNHIFKNLGLKYFWIKKKNIDIDVGVSSSIFTKILKQIQIGRVSGDKRLPYFFMNLSNLSLKTLLKTYFEGDGDVDKERLIIKKNFNISTTTKSKKLASDICIALFRYGIFARCKKLWKRATNTKHNGNWYYRIKISGKTNIVTFLTNVGFQFSRKNNILRGLLDYRENTNIDLAPVNPEEFKLKRESTQLSQKQFSIRLNCSQQLISLIESGKRRPSRNLLNKIVRKFKEFKDFLLLTKFKWDRIDKIKKIRYNKKYVYDLTIAENKTFLAGHGGLFVHNSNYISTMLWDQVDKDYCGILVLDPHDEYFGRNSLGLKDHLQNSKIVYYTINPPPGARSLKINIRDIRPGHFNGTINWSLPQIEALNSFYREYGNEWIEAIIQDKKCQGYQEGTIAVLKRRMISILNLEFHNNMLNCRGIFDLQAGQTTITDICDELEQANTVIIDTSTFPSMVEILIGSLLATEIFSRYRRHKMSGIHDKPVISIILEEAPRVLGKDVLDKGPNIFGTIAREGRKFKIGLTAITQLPSLIPREILANINTKIILGTEMAPERQAIIDSSAQDLSTDSRNIASLDTGEAIITSNFTKFAIPIKIPLFSEFAKPSKEKNKSNFTGVKLG